MPLTKRQIVGVAALVCLTAFIYLFNVLVSLFPSMPSNSPIHFSHRKGGTSAIALAVDGSDRGIYFLSQGSTVADLLKAAGVKPGLASNDNVALRRLITGDKVFLARASSPVITVGKMPAAQVLAVDLPVDINRVSLKDMVLVPGIGEKTAQKIIALREKKGTFHRVEELMEIKGIKEKKLAELRRYFYAGRN